MPLEGYKGETESGLNYSVRVSARAKRCIIKIWGSSLVEVVVPTDFDRSCVKQIMEEQTDLIIHKQEKARILKMKYKPAMIELKAVTATWEVSYDDDNTGGVFVREQPGSKLHVLGCQRDIPSTASALNEWVYRKAHCILPRCIETLNSELCLTYNRITVRRQKTVWGSCSAKRNINLNQNLLFLPKRMVDYVLLHELSHLEQLNHSRVFWDLLESRFKGSRDMSARVRIADSLVPEWAKT